MSRTLFAVSLCLALAGCGGGSDTTGPPDASAPDASAAARDEAPNMVDVDAAMLRDLRITTQPVESRTGGDLVALLGELTVDERSYAVVGTPVAARVSRLYVDVGETVLAGQRLADLTSPALGTARAEYLSAIARLRLSEAALDRKRQLAAERIAPLREVQEAESAAAEARAAVRASRAAITAFGVDAPRDDDEDEASSTFALRSPVAGSVIERAAVVGQMLDPTAPAFRVGNLSTLWLTVHAFERDAVRIRAGVSARVAFSALPGQDFDGVVTVLGRQVDPESRTVPIRIEVRNSASLLRPGMSATAMVPVGAGDAAILTVPVASVQRVRNAWSVFLPADEGHFEIRPIGRGRDLGNEIEVLSGLRAGETVVVDGAFLLKAQAEKGEGGHDDH